MNYELAKQLKDVGFPQDIPTDKKASFIGSVKIPTLSELIEACGNDFKYLERLREPDEEGSFWAQSDNIGVAGTTPEEAVASLWLALNKKKL